MVYVKRHLSIILILLLTLLAITLVIWVFNKRLEHLETKVKTTSQTLTIQDSVPLRVVYPL